jgi:phosphatidylinositol glycan class C protein
LSLSPVLRTLTASTSSDSIWALSAILLLLNAILADYSALNAKKQLTGRYMFCDRNPGPNIDA